MDEEDVLAERFEAHRPRLRAVAYQALGSASEARQPPPHRRSRPRHPRPLTAANSIACCLRAQNRGVLHARQSPVRRR